MASQDDLKRAVAEAAVERISGHFGSSAVIGVGTGSTADLFIDAQKRVLDVVGQQMKTNVKAATQAAESLSSARLASVTELPAKAVKSFFEGEKVLLQSLVEPLARSKVVGIDRHAGKSASRRRKHA